MEDAGPPPLPCRLRPTAPGLWYAAGCGSPCSGCRIALGCFGWGPWPKLGRNWRPASTLPFLPLKAMRSEHALATKYKRTLFLLFIPSEKQHGSFIFSSHLISKTILSLRWPCRGSLTGALSGPHNGHGRPLKQRQPGKRQEEPGQRPRAAWRWVARMSLAWNYSRIGVMGWGVSLSLHRDLSRKQGCSLQRPDWCTRACKCPRFGHIFTWQ